MYTTLALMSTFTSALCTSLNCVSASVVYASYRPPYRTIAIYYINMVPVKLSLLITNMIAMVWQHAQ